MKRLTPLRRIGRAAQRGVSLFITLIALVLLTFAALALLRAVDTSTLIAGNLQFQEAALASGGAGTETAIAWLTANSGGVTLQTNVPGSGYYATSADSCDLTALSSANATNYVDWLGAGASANCGMLPATVPSTTNGVAPGYTVEYVINRICNIPGPPTNDPAVVCASYTNPASRTGSTQIGMSYGEGPLTSIAQQYYRITTRTTGPRNTVRYTQTFVVY